MQAPAAPDRLDADHREGRQRRRDPEAEEQARPRSGIPEPQGLSRRAGEREAAGAGHRRRAQSAERRIAGDLRPDGHDVGQRLIQVLHVPQAPGRSMPSTPLCIAKYRRGRLTASRFPVYGGGSSQHPGPRSSSLPGEFYLMVVFATPSLVERRGAPRPVRSRSPLPPAADESRQTAPAQGFSERGPGPYCSHARTEETARRLRDGHVRQGVEARAEAPGHLSGGAAEPGAQPEPSGRRRAAARGARAARPQDRRQAGRREGWSEGRDDGGRDPEGRDRPRRLRGGAPGRLRPRRRGRRRPAPGPGARPDAARGRPRAGGCRSAGSRRRRRRLGDGDGAGAAANRGQSALQGRQDLDAPPA